MAETSFDVVYDGEAIAEGRMLVRDLAPALLALGDVVAEASATIYPGQTPAALSIKATEEGSFLVQLIVEAAKDFVNLFSGDALTAIVNLKEVLFGGIGVSVFELIRRLKGRQIVKVEPDLIERGHVRLTLSDGTVIEGVPQAVLEIYRNVDVQRHARQVVAPLERDGVDILKFQIDQRVTLELRSTDVASFEPVRIEPTALSDERITMVAEIVSVAFPEGNKWRLDDGDHKFWALMGDDEFQRQVDDGLPFSKGDLLRVRMRVIQSHGSEGLHTERQIEEVLEHIPREPQLRLSGPLTP